jgi:hypothetical protein
VVNDTTQPLDLDGLAVVGVERLEGGTRPVHLGTDFAGARACPECGVLACRVVRGSSTTRPRDLPYGEHGLELVWHKHRAWCAESGCPRRPFTKQVTQIPARCRLTERLRQAAGRALRDAGVTVVQAAREWKVSWPVVMEALRTAAAAVTEAPLPDTSSSSAAPPMASATRPANASEHAAPPPAEPADTSAPHNCCWRNSTGFPPPVVVTGAPRAHWRSVGIRELQYSPAGELVV